MILILLVLAPAPRTVARAESVAALSALKSAYTFHFLNLIRWSHVPSALELCVLGETETGEQMVGSLQDRTVHGHPIRVRRISPLSSRAERCDALYIPEVHRERVPALLALYDRSATLTISDVPSFVSAGGVIGFVIAEGRLRFDINERVASRKGLRISAKLLELAREVRR